MSKTAIAKLSAQSNCPVCGAALVECVTGKGLLGSGAYAEAAFTCSAVLRTSNGQIAIGNVCPSPSYVAVRALNDQVRDAVLSGGEA